MAHSAHNPDDHPYWPELGEPLRWAVEAVRQAPPPAEAVQRSVDRALRIARSSNGPFRGRNLRLCATGALVATLLIGLGVRCTYPPGGYFASTRDVETRHHAVGSRQMHGAPIVGVSRDVQWRPLGPPEAGGLGSPEDSVLLVGLGHLGSHWSDWESFEPVRDMMNDLPPNDRKSVEAYLSNQPDGGRRGPRRRAVRAAIDAWVSKAVARHALVALLDACDEASLTQPEPDKGYKRRKPARRMTLEEGLGEATRRQRDGDSAGAVTVLAGLAGQHPGNAVTGRLIGHRLLALGQPKLAAELLRVVVAKKPRDAASHRALAWALDDAGQAALSALHFEAALALLGGQGGEQEAVCEEYGQMLRRAVRDQQLPKRLRSHLAMRWVQLATPSPSALRVASTCSANVDVILVVIEPDGNRREAVTFRHDDRGPRIYQVRRARAGEYEVQVRLGDKVPAADREACVRVEIEIRSANEEQPARRTILLDKPGELVQVAKVKN
jgi:hypothetical protein